MLSWNGKESKDCSNCNLKHRKCKDAELSTKCWKKFHTLSIKMNELTIGIFIHKYTVLSNTWTKLSIIQTASQSIWWGDIHFILKFFMKKFSNKTIIVEKYSINVNYITTLIMENLVNVILIYQNIAHYVHHLMMTITVMMIITKT